MAGDPLRMIPCRKGRRGKRGSVMGMSRFMGRWGVTALLLSVLVAGCSRDPAETGRVLGYAPPAGEMGTGTIRRDPGLLEIYPDRPRTSDTVHAVLTIVPAAGVRYAWYVNDRAVPGENSLTLGPGIVERGDRLRVEAETGGIRYVSTTVTVGNTPPRVTAGGIEREEDEGGVRIRARCRGKDPDGDPVSFRYLWYVNGEPREAAEDELFLSPDETRAAIELTVIPSDGTNDGEPYRLRAGRANSPPEVALQLRDVRVLDGVVTARVAARDPEGKVLTYELEGDGPGIFLDRETGYLRYEPDVAGTVKTVRVNVRDPDGSYTAVEFPIEYATGRAALVQGGKQP